jgi:hypothetical protein
MSEMCLADDFENQICELPARAPEAGAEGGTAEGGSGWGSLHFLLESAKTIGETALPETVMGPLGVLLSPLGMAAGSDSFAKGAAKATHGEQLEGTTEMLDGLLTTESAAMAMLGLFSAEAAGLAGGFGLPALAAGATLHGDEVIKDLGLFHDKEGNAQGTYNATEEWADGNPLLQILGWGGATGFDVTAGVGLGIGEGAAAAVERQKPGCAKTDSCPNMFGGFR